MIFIQDFCIKIHSAYKTGTCHKGVARDTINAESREPLRPRRERTMLKSILIVVIMAVLFVLAVMFIAKNGGWSSEKGCHGDCSKCHENCDSHTEQK